MVQPGSEGFAGAEAWLMAQQQIPRIAGYLLHGGEDDLLHEVAAQVAVNSELLSKSLETAGGLMNDEVVERMGKVLRSARAINGLSADEQPRRLGTYNRVDEAAFRQAKRSNKRAGRA